MSFPREATVSEVGEFPLIDRLTTKIRPSAMIGNEIESGRLTSHFFVSGNFGGAAVPLYANRIYRDVYVVETAREDADDVADSCAFG